jgi:hypothetical protein
MAEENNTSKGKSNGGAMGCVFLFIIGFIYLIMLFAVRTETLDYTHYAELEVISVNPDAESIDLNQMHAANVKVLKGNLPKDLNLLYVTPKSLSMVKKGYKLKAIITPDHCASWGDFFKVFYNEYNYELVKIRAYTDDKGKYTTVVKEKETEIDHALAYIIVAIIIFLILLNFGLESLTFPKFKEEDSEWSHNVPSWLEWSRIIILLGISAAALIHVYEAYVNGDLDGQTGEVVSMSVGVLFLLVLAYRNFYKRNNYIIINAEKIEYQVGAKKHTIETSKYKQLLISVQKHRGSVVDYTFTFKSEEDEQKFDCSNLGMSSQCQKLYKVITHYMKKGGVTIE